VVDRKHFSAIADAARAALQSLNAYIKAKRDGKAILLSDERLQEFIVRWRALRQRMIDAGCFEQHRLAVFPLQGAAHAALLTLAADVSADDRLPREIEMLASRLAEVVTALEESLPAPPSASPPADSTTDAEQYVTLDQMSALVNRSKKTLARQMNAKGSNAPTPDVEGGGGKPHEWVWSKIRPWLEKQFNRQLPERFPQR
jgi:hypothetical protein